MRRPPRRRARPHRPVRRAPPSSTSPRRRSRPRSSTAPSRYRSCSTCGPSGAGRASSSRRCSSGWPPRAPAPGCWPRSTSTPTRPWPRACACRASRRSRPSGRASSSPSSPARSPRSRPASSSPSWCGPPPAERCPRRRGRGRPAEDPRLDAAEAALERGDLAAAEAAYQAILDAEPDHPEAGLALKQVQLFRRAEEAGPDALAAADAAPDDVAAQTRAADFLLGTGNVDAAFDLAARRGGAHLGGGPRPGPHAPGRAVRRRRRRGPPRRCRPAPAHRRAVLSRPPAGAALQAWQDSAAAAGSRCGTRRPAGTRSGRDVREAPRGSSP